jgi:hypothetical protein
MLQGCDSGVTKVLQVSGVTEVLHRCDRVLRGFYRGVTEEVLPAQGGSLFAWTAHCYKAPVRVN